MTLPIEAKPLVERALANDGPIIFLTGAGISAESGIPTFRGEEGYWKIGSKNWHPQELATAAAFAQLPDEVWGWYLFRRGVCRAASPNAAHVALADLERRLGDRFVLVTQNVDGLHLRAGNSLDRTWQIHGNADFMRCSAECTPQPWLIPDGVPVAWEKGRVVDDDIRALLACPHCGSRGRPHILWFDETYDEPRYRWESSCLAAAEAALLVVIGTSGATSLPVRMATIVSELGAPLLVLNPETSRFSDLAGMNPNGLYVPTTAGASVPELATYFG